METYITATSVSTILCLVSVIHAAKRDYDFEIKTSNNNLCYNTGFPPYDLCGSIDDVYFRLCNTNLGQCGMFQKNTGYWNPSDKWFSETYTTFDIGTPNQVEFVMPRVDPVDPIEIKKVKIDNVQYDCPGSPAHRSLSPKNGGCDTVIIDLDTNTWNPVQKWSPTCVYSMSELTATFEPTPMPTSNTASPSKTPSVTPTKTPTTNPSMSPSQYPTQSPTTLYPTYNPTTVPTTIPTQYPSINPTNNPTYQPTFIPTFVPSEQPTANPTNTPSNIPTTVPSVVPTNDPTIEPTVIPTLNPTFTLNPTINPTSKPTDLPTTVPSEKWTTMLTEISKTEGYSAVEVNSQFLGMNNTTLMLVLIGIAAAVLLVLCICYCCFKRRKSQKKQLKITENVVEHNNEMELMRMQPESAKIIPQSPESQVIDENGNDMLEQWLDKIEMKEYYSLFIEQGFGAKMSMLEELDDNDLLQIGIKKMADRKLILKEMSLLKNMVNGKVVEPGKKQDDLENSEGSDTDSNETKSDHDDMYDGNDTIVDQNITPLMNNNNVKMINIMVTEGDMETTMGNYETTAGNDTDIASNV